MVKRESWNDNSINIFILISVPLLSITQLNSILLNSTTARITWIFEPNDFRLLNGKFRTYALTIYRDFSKIWFFLNIFIDSQLFFLIDMSTLQTIETIYPYWILNDLQPATHYFVTVAVCNHFDCGPSSSLIKIETLSSCTFYSLKTFF